VNPSVATLEVGLRPLRHPDDIVAAHKPILFSRPVGLAELGSESVFGTPYVIRSPQRVYVGRNVRVEQRALLSVVERNAGQSFSPVLRIGDHTIIGSDLILHCAGEIDIGSRVCIASFVYIGDSFRIYDDPALAPRDMPVSGPRTVRICRGAFIGVRAVILPGVTIGEGAIVAAGSVVTRDIPDFTVALGNPARVVQSWDKQRERWVSSRAY
jgi:acetyltransferase-like isoleucine patch superfamily enzyme